MRILLCGNFPTHKTEIWNERTIIHEANSDAVDQAASRMKTQTFLKLKHVLVINPDKLAYLVNAVTFIERVGSLERS